VRPTQYDSAPASVQSGLVTLTFHLLTLKLLQNVSRGTDNLPPNFGVSATFRCRVMGKRASDWLGLMTLTFDVTAHVGDAHLRTLYVYQVWSSSALPFRRCLTSVTTLCGLVTLTFDPSISKWGQVSPVLWASCPPMFSLLRPSIVDSVSDMWQTDRQMTTINA